MGILSREDAMTSRGKYAMIEVDVTEWGPIDAEIDAETGKPEKTLVYVRELSGREKDAFESGLVSIKGRKQKLNLEDMRARMAVLVCCDAEGNAIFRPEDVEWLTKKSCRPLTRIYNAAKELNDLSNEDEEELLKN
ncbi:MAG: hypothetical protein LBJ67_05705 [Planctomycetaceae bacterium]|jgi:hypothetical protein|nr:hypothetical protein [Planctomycetaceae bacterium]